MIGIKRLTHMDDTGRPRMVYVGDKAETQREARAVGRIYMKPETLALVKQGRMQKGDVLSVAQTAGIMAAKQTWQLIPMCHPLLLTGIEMEFGFCEEKSAIEIRSVVLTKGQTGVEMEALCAVSAAALTIYDMCKAVDKEMEISDIRVIYKAGGKSGTWEV